MILQALDDLEIFVLVAVDRTDDQEHPLGFAIADSPGDQVTALHRLAERRACVAEPEPSVAPAAEAARVRR